MLDAHRAWLLAKHTRPDHIEQEYIARLDQQLTILWQQGRCAIEDLESIVSRLEVLQQTPSYASHTIVAICKTCRHMLLQARLREQHVRDDIQINVGNLSLIESRKSIQQAGWFTFHLSKLHLSKTHRHISHKLEHMFHDLLIFSQTPLEEYPF